MQWENTLNDYLNIKKKRIEIMKKLGMPFSDDLQTDLDTICENAGNINIPVRLYELTGAKCSLCLNDYLSIKDLGLEVTKLSQSIIDLGLLQGKGEFDIKDGKITVDWNFSEEAKELISGYSNKDFDRLLTLYQLEIDTLSQFKAEVYLPKEIEELSGGIKRYNGEISLFFVPKKKDFRILSDFYRCVLGSHNVSSPIADTGKYHVLFDEGIDQESWLRITTDRNEKIAGIIKNLKKQVQLEQKLNEHSNGNKINVSMYSGFISTKMQFTNTFDYLKEFITSVVTGRNGEDLRLAKASELVDREYIKGSNSAIDKLLQEAKRFYDERLNPIGLEHLKCYTNLDSQPSNYFISGKLNDLDKVNFASSLYMAARLLGHPEVQKLAETDSWFDMYTDIKKISKDEQTRQCFKDHIAWISMYHAITYECRVKDKKQADAYFRIAMSHIDNLELKVAYVSAIAQSDCNGILHRNLDMM